MSHRFHTDFTDPDLYGAEGDKAGLLTAVSESGWGHELYLQNERSLGAHTAAPLTRYHLYNISHDPTNPTAHRTDRGGREEGVLRDEQVSGELVYGEYEASP